MMNIRLNKYISQAGVASRREANRLIKAGRVRVNGKVVQVLGYKLASEQDVIEVDGKTVFSDRSLLYVLLNKPPGYLVTRKDPLNRPTILNLLPRFPERVNPVGRLDFESEGLLLLTNDGDLALRLTHPRYGVKKIYEIKVKGSPDPSSIKRLEKGIFLDQKKTAPAEVSKIRRGEKISWMTIQIQEGRKREIRRMCEVIGHPVLSLIRVRFAGVSLGRMKSGQWRYLTEVEVKNLRKSVNLD
jgi:pseudouridine synthase